MSDNPLAILFGWAQPSQSAPPPAPAPAAPGAAATSTSRAAGADPATRYVSPPQPRVPTSLALMRSSSSQQPTPFEVMFSGLSAPPAPPSAARALGSDDETEPEEARMPSKRGAASTSKSGAAGSAAAAASLPGIPGNGDFPGIPGSAGSVILGIPGSDSDFEYDLYGPSMSKRAKTLDAAAPRLRLADLQPEPDGEEDDDLDWLDNGTTYDDEETRAADERAELGYPALDISTKPVAPNEELRLEPAAGNGQVGVLPGHINQYLRDYQKEGVKFLWRAYAGDQGALLADEMGLGKTVQAVCFLIAMFGKTATPADQRPPPPPQQQIPVGVPPKLAIVVCPTSVMAQWQRELKTWSFFKVAIAHGPNREKALADAKERRVEVLVCSYCLLTSEAATLRELKPTVVIFDEAHTLKNQRAQVTLAARSLGARVKIAMTGTPMSNDIKELWTLLDLVSNEQVGEKKHFNETYGEPIKQGLKQSARKWEIAKRLEAFDALAKVLEKWMLMRRKTIIAKQMPNKVDKIVFAPLDKTQAEVYERVLRTPDFEWLRTACRPCACGSGIVGKECCVPDGARTGPLWREIHPNNEDCGRCPSCMCLPAMTKLLNIANSLDLVRACRTDTKEVYEKNAAFAKMAFVDSDDEDMDGNVPRYGRWSAEAQPWEMDKRLVDPSPPPPPPNPYYYYQTTGDSVF
mmetsp:Transcript_31258/g.71824  ORF Transcript_31258/g.71824 Transcript_31258/m.71824 type:complete len:690 (+) Transcript_31258:208-2277(+)